MGVGVYSSQNVRGWVLNEKWENFKTNYQLWAYCSFPQKVLLPVSDVGGALDGGGPNVAWRF